MCNLCGMWPEVLDVAGFKHFLVRLPGGAGAAGCQTFSAVAVAVQVRTQIEKWSSCMAMLVRQAVLS